MLLSFCDGSDGRGISIRGVDVLLLMKEGTIQTRLSQSKHVFACLFLPILGSRLMMQCKREV